jgi:GTP-binding protein
MGLFSRATFFTTVNELHALPLHGGKEVAFAGRSNAGKSSAINTLANHVRLAFVSKTPGRYAKVPPAIRAHWENLLSQYLQTRSALAGLVVIMDSRHPLTPLDEQMLDWFMPTGKPVHILLTKSDKMSRQQSSKTLLEVKAYLKEHYPNYTVQLFSSLKKQGLEEAEAKIASWLIQE